MCDEATHLRADLHEVKGRAKQQAREMRDLLRVAQSLGPDDSGRFVDWQGDAVPW